MFPASMLLYDEVIWLCNNKNSMSGRGLIFRVAASSLWASTSLMEQSRMSYELYTLAGSCSMAIHAVMNELGLAPNVHIMDKTEGENGLKSTTFKKMNPRANAPFITEDGKGVGEGAAIVAYLCDKEGKLLPKTGHERAKALQWLMFANSTLHPAYGRTFWLNTYLPEAVRDEALKTARSQIQDLWNYVEAELEKSGGTYLCGSEITCGDFLIATIANWNPVAYKFGPKTKALLASVSARPSYQKALSAESIEYKAAA
ncbi:MAG: glutathione S-transferase family protein [Micavibrio aeruginosavorus]|uniref:Glutathione S-transferase family protein n=1 Tax=Micavibrio aeruginosavorus TaxID=349221 RepID=A0A2W5Q272_9BACT|nr:MAG: glutathione S-transferase family protein [Micavibrio aeruginosavorus]